MESERQIRTDGERDREERGGGTKLEDGRDAGKVGGKEGGRRKTGEGEEHGGRDGERGKRSRGTWRNMGSTAQAWGKHEARMSKHFG